MENGIFIKISISNNSMEPKKFRLPKGTPIESDCGEIQNIIVAKEFVDTLQPGEQKDILVEGYCMNLNLKYPQQSSGRLTEFLPSSPMNDQEASWNFPKVPDLGKNKHLKAIRIEMENRIREHGLIDIITSDIEIPRNSIKGETVREKCFYLVDYCYTHNLLKELLKRLHEEFPRSVVFGHWIYWEK